MTVSGDGAIRAAVGVGNRVGAFVASLLDIGLGVGTAVVPEVVAVASVIVSDVKVGVSVFVDSTILVGTSVFFESGVCASEFDTNVGGEEGTIVVGFSIGSVIGCSVGEEV